MVFFNELHGAGGVLPGELALVFPEGIDPGFLFVQGKWRIVVFLGRMMWPHVIGIRQAEEFVEALACGQKLRLIAKVPFPYQPGGIAPGVSTFRQWWFPQGLSP